MKTVYKDGGVLITDDFSPALTFNCGQCFRFSERGGAWEGVAFGQTLTARETPDGVLLGCSQDSFHNIWRGYLDLGRDYAAARGRIGVNAFMREAADFGRGIRILRQDFWEALCSFIISQNNNIPRIRGVIERLCAYCGSEADGPHPFPDAEVVSRLSVDELRGLGAGYRAEYIVGAARAVSDGELSAAMLNALSVEDAREALTRVRGVGVKVADCVLLYGLGRMDAFPQDVWMKRAMAAYFPNGLPEAAEAYAGIAQQYIFHYARAHLQRATGPFP